MLLLTIGSVVLQSITRKSPRLTLSCYIDKMMLLSPHGDDDCDEESDDGHGADDGSDGDGDEHCAGDRDDDE